MQTKIKNKGRDQQSNKNQISSTFRGKRLTTKWTQISSSWKLKSSQLAQINKITSFSCKSVTIKVNSKRISNNNQKLVAIDSSYHLFIVSCASFFVDVCIWSKGQEMDPLSLYSQELSSTVLFVSSHDNTCMQVERMAK